ncbi:MAG: hypothetical protein ACI4MJ_07050 [Aristaeellaceae bacterium]
MLTSHVADIMAQLAHNVPSALDSAGQAAVALVRQQLESGYGEPVKDTGALMASIAHTVDGDTVHIGSPLSYAGHVHDGTRRMPGRPFLSDALLGHGEDLARVMADALRQGV